jgi:hypothetical protein
MEVEIEEIENGGWRLVCSIDIVLRCDMFRKQHMEVCEYNYIQRLCTTNFIRPTVGGFY